MNCVSWNNCPSHASLWRIPTFFMLTPVAGPEIGGGDDDDDGGDEEDDDDNDSAERDIGR